MSKVALHFAFIVTFYILFSSLPTRVFALDRIGVRQGAAGGEFYDTTTGAKFTPRGNNYLIFGDQYNPQTNSTVQGHAIFDPGKYNPTDIASTLTQMQQSDYNTVRVFLSDNTIGNPAGGLSQTYMDNFADFLTKAAARNIYVLPMMYAIPKQGGYYPQPSALTTQFEGFNAFYMTRPFIDAKKQYLQDFITELRKRNAPLDHILGYELDNEIQFNTNAKPFTVAGTVQTAFGPFNMSDPTQRQQAQDSNMVEWAYRVQDTVKQYDPGALVTVSAIHPYWLIADPANGGSNIDFVDIHPYPALGPLASQMAALQISSNKKPIVAGEFGADKYHYLNLASSATVLRDWQVQSCQYNVQGWITWAWGQSATNQNGFWSVEESNGVINQALAPAVRANPCIAANSTPPPTPSPATKPGDINNDGKVDIFDYNLLVANFGRPYTIFDYNQLIANFGK